MEQELLSEMMLAHNALEEASHYNLESELFVWALRYMKENPDKTIEQAIKYSMDEWVN